VETNAQRVGLRLAGAMVALFVTMPSPVGQLQPPVQYFPRFHGQWAGPYDLDGTPLTDYLTGEIVHAAVLPPPTGALLVTQRTERVVFLARTTVACNLACSGLDTTPQVFGRAYLWDRLDPSNVTLIAPPAGYPQTGVQDFFCGGHTFLPTGVGSWSEETIMRMSAPTSIPPVARALAATVVLESTMPGASIRTCSGLLRGRWGIHDGIRRP